MRRYLYLLLFLCICLSTQAQEGTQPLLTVSHGERLKDAYLSTDRLHLLTTSSFHLVKLWDLTSGELLAEHRVGKHLEQVITFADSSGYLIRSRGTADCTDCLAGFLHLLNAEGDLRIIIGNSGGLGAVTLNPTETMFLLREDGEIKIYVLQGQELQTLPYNNLSSIHWYASEHILFNIRQENVLTIIIWDTVTQSEILRAVRSEALNGIDWQTERSGLSSHRIVIEDESLVRLFDADGQLVVWMSSHPAISTSQLYGSDARYILLVANPQLASDTRPAIVSIWDETGQQIGRITNDNYLHTVLWDTRQSRLLTVAQTESTIDVWTIFAEKLYTLSFNDIVRSAIWSVDSTTILAWSSDRTVRSFNAMDGSLYRLYPMDGLPEVAMFNRDGTRILARTGLYPTIPGQSWTGAHEARLWTLDRDLLGVFTHEARMLGAAWIADESRLLTWSYDGVVKVWQILGE